MSGRKQRNLKATRILRFIHVPHRIASCQLCRHHDIFALQSPEPEMPDIMNIWYQGVRENLTEGNTHCRCDAMIPIHSVSAAFFPAALPSSRVMKMMNAAQGKKSKWSRMQKFVVNLLSARLFSCSCMAISSPAYTLITTSLLFALLFLIFAHVDDVWNHLVKKRNRALFRLK